MIVNETTPAVVTGASSGLGEGMARALAARGAKVTIFDVNAEAGEKVASDIGGVFAEVEVSDAASVTAGLEKARAAHGQERITVNCAGIVIAARTVSRGTAHDLAAYTKVLTVNLIGTFNVSSQSAAGMVAADPINDDGERGVIVNTSSVAAYDGQIGQVAYASSKAGIAGMTLPMARDLSRDGVRVCALAPGLFGTPMLLTMPEDIQESLARQVPFPSRFGTTEEFASLIVHIAENPMLNGEVIRLDGAIRMGPR